MQDTVWTLLLETWRQIWSLPSTASESEGHEIGFHILILMLTVVLYELSKDQIFAQMLTITSPFLSPYFSPSIVPSFEFSVLPLLWASQVVLIIKNLPANAGDIRDTGSIPEGQGGGREIPWRRAGQPTSVFLPGESHGQRSLTGYSPQGCRVRHNWSDLACMYPYE